MLEMHPCVDSRFLMPCITASTIDGRIIHDNHGMAQVYTGTSSLAFTNNEQVKKRRKLGISSLGYSEQRTSQKQMRCKDRYEFLCLKCMYVCEIMMLIRLMKVDWVHEHVCVDV